MNNFTEANIYGSTDDVDYSSGFASGVVPSNESYINTYPTLSSREGSGSELHMADQLEEEGSILWWKITLTIIIFVIGTIGNLGSLFVIIVLKEYKKSVLHMYVLQLAIADLLFLLTLPFKMTEDINREWPFADWLCTAKEMMLFLNYNASVWFLMVMSIDRYIAVCHSFSTILTKLREPLAAGCIICLVWFISILSCLPVIHNTYKAGTNPTCTCRFSFTEDLSVQIQKGCEGKLDYEYCVDLVTEDYENKQKCRDDVDVYGYENSGDSGSGGGSSGFVSYKSVDENDMSVVIADECHYFSSPQKWFTFLYTNFVVLYIIPILVMAVAYGCIIHRVKNTNMPNLRKSSTTQSFKTSDNISIKKRKKSVKLNIRNKVTIMSATLVSSFIICWLPFHAIHLAKIKGINLHYSKGYICENLSIFASLLAYINSVINPYLYSFLGTDFGKRWRLLGKCCIRIEKNARNVQTTVRRGIERRTGRVLSRRTTNLNSTSGSNTKHTNISRGKVSMMRSSEGEMAA